MKRDERCVVCDGGVAAVFTKRVLQRYDVRYFRCSDCGFLQTENPWWLEEAYVSSLTALDVYAVSRSLEQARQTRNLVLNHLDPHGRFLDYGGSAGLLTRHQRDFGLDYYRYDRYAPNLFAQCFDLADLPEGERRFELVTCFEVMEHLEEPMQTLREILALTDTVFFSTGLQPASDAQTLAQWDYLACLHGQHISFFDTRSLRRAADLLGCNLLSDNLCTHLISRRDLTGFTWERSLLRKVRDRMGGHARERRVGSLTLRDAAFAEQVLLNRATG